LFTPHYKGVASVGLKKRHAGNAQIEVEHVEVGDQDMKELGAGVWGGVRRGACLAGRIELKFSLTTSG